MPSWTVYAQTTAEREMIILIKLQTDTLATCFVTQFTLELCKY